MSCDDTVQILRSTGRRFTVQRLRVASALRHASGHRTAEEIHRMVLDEDPVAGIPLSTVYRTLGDLREMRLVAEVGAGTGKSTYEWVNADQPHHHLVCQRCEREFELSGEVLGTLGAEVRKLSGFESFLDHLVLEGLCADCRAAAEES